MRVCLSFTLKFILCHLLAIQIRTTLMHLETVIHSFSLCIPLDLTNSIANLLILEEDHDEI